MDSFFTTKSNKLTFSYFCRIKNYLFVCILFLASIPAANAAGEYVKSVRIWSKATEMNGIFAIHNLVKEIKAFHELLYPRLWNEATVDNLDELTGKPCKALNHVIEKALIKREEFNLTEELSAIEDDDSLRVDPIAPKVVRDLMSAYNGEQGPITPWGGVVLAVESIGGQTYVTPISLYYNSSDQTGLRYISPLRTFIGDLKNLDKFVAAELITDRFDSTRYRESWEWRRLSNKEKTQGCWDYYYKFKNFSTSPSTGNLMPYLRIFPTEKFTADVNSYNNFLLAASINVDDGQGGTPRIHSFIVDDNRAGNALANNKPPMIFKLTKDSKFYGAYKLECDKLCVTSLVSAGQGYEWLSAPASMLPIVFCSWVINQQPLELYYVPITAHVMDIAVSKAENSYNQKPVLWPNETYKYYGKTLQTNKLLQLDK